VAPNRGDATAKHASEFIDVFDIAPDGIVVVDETGEITAANAQLATMFGYDAAELVGQPVELLLPERFRERHIAERDGYVARPSRRPMGLTGSLFGRGKQGEEFPVEISLSFQRDPRGGLQVIAFVRDVTTRRQIEQELRASEESFRLLVEGVGDHAIYMLDPSGRVVTWNPGAQRIKGWSADEILGQHFSVFYNREDVATGQPERDLERATREGRSQAEGWRVRAGGQRFWAETTLSALRDELGTLRGFAKVTRDRTESLQARARLESIGELNRAVLEQRPEDELLALIVSRARAMVSATLVVAWSPSARGDELVVTSAEGDGASALLGTHAPENSLITTVARAARTENVSDLRGDLRVPREIPDTGMESGLFVPLHAADETFGVIGALVARGREPMQPHETDLLQAFGAQAAVSFAYARARRDVEQLHLVSERERIARDLHDSVIQRLFAVGLSLEATGRRPAAETAERLHRAVADIDDTIRSIRSSIFSLEDRPDDDAGLRSRVLEVVAEATPALGFEPSVRFEGPVETLANDDITENIVATLREALANVARHAHATRARVTVTAGEDIGLIVDDDGVGGSTFQRDGGHGVANLSERARMLGGQASVTPLSPNGTRVDWRVPTPD